MRLLLSSYYFQESNFFRAKFLPRSYLMRVDSSLGRLLLRRRNLFTIKISIEELLFRSRYFYTASNFSEQLLFQQRYFKIATFQWSFFLETVNFLEKQYFATYFFRRCTFTQLHFLSTATLLTLDSLSVSLTLCLEYLPVQKPRSLGNLCNPQAIFLSLSRTLSISNISLSQTNNLVSGRFFSLYLYRSFYTIKQN